MTFIRPDSIFPDEELSLEETSAENHSPEVDSSRQNNTYARGRVSEALVNDLFEQVALERSHEAFDELYSLLYDKAFAAVFRVLRSEEDARDLMQEIFAQVWEKAPGVYPHKNSAGWIIEFAKRRAIDETRSSRFRHSRASDAFDTAQHEHLLDNADLLDEELGAEKVRERLFAAMEVLTTGQKRVMDLLLQGKSYRFISELLQSTEGAVRKTVFDSYRKMRPLVISGTVPAKGPAANRELATSGSSPAQKPAKKSVERASESTGARTSRSKVFAELPNENADTNSERDALLHELEQLITPHVSHH